MKKISVLIFILICGCTSTKYVEVAPECEPPPLPNLPEVAQSELESLSDDTYWKLEKREDDLYGWGEEMEDMLKSVCEPPQ